MKLIRRLILALAFASSIASAFAAPPPPVPALPDSERRTSYSISGTNCSCAVNFALFADTTDVDNWLEVWVAGVRKLSTDPTFGWTITSPTGPLATIPRPITDAVLTFNSVQTGAVQIVGAFHPRRLTQFQENRGVAARDLNQAFSTVLATMRESWDKTNDLTGRAIQGLPGESIATLPSAAARASSFICWDATGLIPLACAPGLGTGNVVGPNTSTNGHIALWSGTTGRILVDGGTPGTGTVSGPVSSTNNAFARWNGTLGLVLQDGPTIIPLANGGTNNNLTASNGGVAYSDASGIQILSGTATARQMLQSGASVAPAWSTATWPATTTINQLLYSSAANTVAGLATAASGALVTDGTGLPSISSTLPAAVQLNITQLGTITAGTWTGTAIAVANGGTGGTSASGTLLDNITGFASTGYVKRTGAGTYAFNNPIPLADGGTNANLTASNGGLVYSTASAFAVLAGTGTAGQIPLSGSNVAPAWSTSTWPNTITANNLLYSAGSNAVSGLATGNNGTLITSAGGVPSISSTLPTAVQSNITQLGTIGAGVWNGTAITGTFIATNTVANSNLAQAAGATLKGNTGSTTANVADFTIQGLVNKSIPSANSDFLLIWDNVTGTFKSITPGQLVSGTTAGVASLNGLTGALAATNGGGLTISAAGSTITFSGPISPPGGRITLTANTPVMTASASGASGATLRYDCYASNQVPYFTGSIDAFDTISSCEVTDAMVSAASAGQVVANNLYDVWWVHSGANHICLAMSASGGGGGGWSADTGGSNTARGTGYTQLDYSTRSYVTNKNSITNCFNAAVQYGPVSANQGTYLGTIFSPVNGQSAYIFGASASGGTAGQFGVCNYYGRQLVASTVTDSGTSYTYATATIRQARASAGNQIQTVSCDATWAFDLAYATNFQTTATATDSATVGIGLDATAAFTSTPFQCETVAAQALICSTTSALRSQPSAGLHTFSGNELGDTSTTTFDLKSANQLSISFMN